MASECHWDRSWDSREESSVLRLALDSNYRQGVLNPRILRFSVIERIAILEL